MVSNKIDYIELIISVILFIYYDARKQELKCVRDFQNLYNWIISFDNIDYFRIFRFLS